jgi:trehalose 6-phosphate synthase/phosphatase
MPHVGPKLPPWPDDPRAEITANWLNPETRQRLLDGLEAARHLVLLLDYDGTLVPFAPTPEQARPDPALLELLSALTFRPHTEVNIVSGRDVATLEKWFAHLPLGLFAEHGLWARPRSEKSWHPLRPISIDWKRYILPMIEETTRQTPGSHIEDKSASIAWHYRLVDPQIAPTRVRDLCFFLDNLIPKLPVFVLMGDKVVEVRMRGVNKGLVISNFYSNPSNATFLALGDDATDEDLFAALPQGSIAVHVGPNPSCAPYRLRDFSDARRFLRSLLPT